MDVLLILIYIFLAISVFTEIGAFAFIAFKSRGTEADVLWALAAEDEAEFINRMRARLEKERKMRSFPIPYDALPRSDEEYYSFYHYIYLPLFLELQKRIEEINRKNMVSRLVFYGLTLFLVPTLHIIGEGTQVVLLAVSMIAIGVTLMLRS